MAKTDEPRPTQEFFYMAPDADLVQLVGDFTHWQTNPINMARQPGGIWRASVALPPGSYHYRFLVDGQWSDDPECTLRMPNVFGTHNMVREVSAGAEVVAQVASVGKKPSLSRRSKRA
jgi:1,4-alpha-glucan branching enzyme